jgi:hypothetical protein
MLQIVTSRHHIRTAPPWAAISGSRIFVPWQSSALVRIPAKQTASDIGADQQETSCRP